LIDLKDIKIGYDKSLFSIDKIQLEKGQLYALIGANGKGKTTFLKTLVGEINPFKGEVIIDQLSQTKLSRIEKAKKVAFVTSKQQEVEFLKVIDFIRLGRTPYTNLFGKLTIQDEEIVEKVISQLNIDHLSHLFTNQISDGEKQLVAIAKSLAQETDIIILDEPTAFLDYSNRMIVLNLLKHIAEDYQKCILFSSHDIDSVLELNTSILLLNQHQKELNQFSSDTINKAEIISQSFL
jgi:iron complex transport system ATP-binding protein